MASDRPELSPSDAVLSAPLGLPHLTGLQNTDPAARPVISGSPDAVIGAPLSPPPEGAREGLQLGVDSAGGYTVPRELDGHKTRRPPHRRP